MNKLISVIIPNYNHVFYLPQRIESVLNQTYRDIEVILMDDCSLDDSRVVIEKYAALDARIRIVYNEVNSGSTFKQWNKGIGLANGEYIWLAESDDYADATFLHTLVAKLDADQTIGLAYCDSLDVDEANEVVGNRTKFYKELDAKLWTKDFILDGKSLLNKFMSYRNIIPNASAVVIRRTVLTQIGPADETFRINGDWIFWAKIMAVTKIAFVSAHLNYFRQHLNNVRSDTFTNGTSLLEQTRVMGNLVQLTELEPYFFDRMVNYLIALWFKGMMEYDIPLARHRQIHRNLKLLDKNFSQRFRREFAKRMFPNKLSGLRQLLGDGLLYRFTKRRHTRRMP